MFSMTDWARAATDYRDRRSTGSQLRARRIAPLLAAIDAVHAERGRVEIIDIGGTAEYWGIVARDFLEMRRVRITIVNLPGVSLPPDHGPFVFAHGDGCDLRAYADHAFDIVHSNSVLEHVGDWSAMQRFAREVKRLAPRYFVQTPNYWFPIEPHCMLPLFHWLPRALRVRWLAHADAGLWQRAGSIDAAARIVDGARLVSRTRFRALFDDAQLRDEKLFWLTKSFVALRMPAAGGATAGAA